MLAFQYRFLFKCGDCPGARRLQAGVWPGDEPCRTIRHSLPACHSLPQLVKTTPCAQCITGHQSTLDWYSSTFGLASLVPPSRRHAARTTPLLFVLAAVCTVLLSYIGCLCHVPPCHSFPDLPSYRCLYRLELFLVAFVPCAGLPFLPSLPQLHSTSPSPSHTSWPLTSGCWTSWSARACWFVDLWSCTGVHMWASMPAWASS